MALYKDPVPNVKMNVAKAVRVAGNALKDKTVEVIPREYSQTK